MAILPTLPPISELEFILDANLSLGVATLPRLLSYLICTFETRRTKVATRAFYDEFPSERRRVSSPRFSFLLDTGAMPPKSILNKV